MSVCHEDHGTWEGTVCGAPEEHGGQGRQVQGRVPRAPLGPHMGRSGWGHLLPEGQRQ